ncbi:hypothetical protein EQV77_03720 [Halobacillus fulvus]|nr:hypothetical protein EQV77_03720 [Halobacillus fulvus]
MDAKERRTGQKAVFSCPHCSKPVEVTAYDLLKKEEAITCPHCQSSIYLEHSEALHKLKNQWEK